LDTPTCKQTRVAGIQGGKTKSARDEPGSEWHLRKLRKCTLECGSRHPKREITWRDGKQQAGIDEENCARTNQAGVYASRAGKELAAHSRASETNIQENEIGPKTELSQQERAMDLLRKETKL
jgi:hypothetical protein